jgi:hypothetical protein
MKRIALTQSQVPLFLNGATELRVAVKPQPRLTESPFRSDHLTWWVWKTDVKLTTDALTDNIQEACPYPVGSLVALTERWRATDVALSPDAMIFKYRVEYATGQPRWIGLSAARAAELHIDLILDWSQSVFKPAITMPAEFSRFPRRVAAVRVEHGELWEWVLTLEVK